MQLGIELKEFVKRLLPNPVFETLREARWRIRFGGLDHRDIFRKIHRQNMWKNSESVSGSGSTVAGTEMLRGELARWLTREDIRSFVDLPCGDFNWMRLVDFPPEMTYLGMDVVEALVASNQSRYGGLRRAFEIGDILTSQLPVADAFFCKDLFIHFPNDPMRAAIARARENCRFFLASTFPNTPKNAEIQFGNARRVNLALLLGEPVEMLKDFGDGVTDRYIGVWRGEL